MRFEMPTISNPLDHCEARKALYYAWAKITHPPGSNVSLAANNAYQNHYKIECEVCIEYEESHAKGMF